VKEHKDNGLFVKPKHVGVVKVFYSPTGAQVNYLKNNIEIHIKTTPTCFGAVTPSSGSALFVLAKVTAVKIVN
jgi:hypothetical protein